MSAHDDLLALAILGLAEGALGGVEGVPALPGGVVDAALAEEVGEVAVEVGAKLAGCGVGKQHIDGFLGVGLGVADQPHRAALDPAGGVQAGQDLAVFVDDVAAVVGDDVFDLIEGHTVDGVGAVAHRGVDRLD